MAGYVPCARLDWQEGCPHLTPQKQVTVHVSSVTFYLFSRILAEPLATDSHPSEARLRRASGESTVAMSLFLASCVS